MTDERKLCAATTKSGAPCKNKAQAGSDYCYVHRNLAVNAAPAPEAKRGVAQSAQFHELITELDQLVNEMRAQLPDYTPPAFSPQALIALLKENLHRFTPEMQL